MTKRNWLAATVLGALAAASAGCGGSEPASQSGEKVAQGDWAITQMGFSQSQTECRVSAVFDISAAKNIGFIGVSGMNHQLQDMNIEVFSVNENGQRQRQDASQVTASRLEQIQEASSRQDSSAHNSAANDASHMDRSVTDSSSASASRTETANTSSKTHDATATNSNDSSVANDSDSSALQENESDTSSNTLQESQIAASNFSSDWVQLGATSTLSDFRRMVDAMDASQRSRAFQQQSSHDSTVQSSDSSMSEHSADTSSDSSLVASEDSASAHNDTLNESADSSSSVDDAVSSVSNEQASRTVQALDSSNLSSSDLENTSVVMTDQLQQQHLLIEVTFDNQNRSEQSSETRNESQSLDLSILAGTLDTLGAQQIFPQSISACVK